MNTYKHGISLVINTKNEERNIKDCIISMKHAVDEIVVTDMHSTDRTVEIARNLGANIYTVKNYPYVEPARNYAISKATKEWVIYLDADERPGHLLLKKLRDIASKDKYEVVEIPRKNIIFGKWIKHGHWWPDYHPQMFRKDKFIVWPKTIHSVPSFRKARIIKLPANESNAVIHNSISSIDEMLSKWSVYTRVEESISKHDASKFDKAITYVNNEFVGRYINEKGYKDGTYGFFLCKFMEFYRFIELARYWERGGFGSIYKQEDMFNFMSLQISKNKVKELEIIKSSKFYKLWKKYNYIKEKVLGKG